MPWLIGVLSFFIALVHLAEKPRIRAIFSPERADKQRCRLDSEAYWRHACSRRRCSAGERSARHSQDVVIQLWPLPASHWTRRHSRARLLLCAALFRLLETGS